MADTTEGLKFGIFPIFVPEFPASHHRDFPWHDLNVVRGTPCKLASSCQAGCCFSKHCDAAVFFLLGPAKGFSPTFPPISLALSASSCWLEWQTEKNIILYENEHAKISLEAGFMLEQFCEIQFMLPKDIKHTANHYTHTHTHVQRGKCVCGT